MNSQQFRRAGDKALEQAEEQYQGHYLPAKFVKLVQEKMKIGVARGAAIMAVARSEPESHSAWVSNQCRPEIPEYSDTLVDGDNPSVFIQGVSLFMKRGITKRSAAIRQAVMKFPKSHQAWLNSGCILALPETKIGGTL